LRRKSKPCQIRGRSVQAIEGFLVKYEPDAAKAANLALSLSGLPSADLWKNLAVLALGALVPGGTAASLLNLAVELAYNIYKRSKAARLFQLRLKSTQILVAGVASVDH
jgi:hypothetical protein